VEFDIDEDGLCRDGLRERGCTPVQREDVGIAVFLERARTSRMLGIVPWAGGEDHDPRKEIINYPYAGERRTAIVKDLDYVAVLESAGLGVGAPDLDRLATLYLHLTALWRRIELAVQPLRWLVREQMEGKALDERRSEPRLTSDGGASAGDANAGASAGPSALLRV
jgi:hypothetical protein